MPHLSLNFLGGFEVLLDGRPVAAFGTEKTRVLLAYLAIEAHRAHRRAHLSAMFWPEASEKNAAHNLSQTLLRLRKALNEPKASGQAAFVWINTQEIQFNELSNSQVDVARFRALAALVDRHKHLDPLGCDACRGWLLQAAELYRGDLLAGLFVPDSVAFEEWRVVQQEELHGQALEVFRRLAAGFEQRGEHERVQEVVRRLIALEPWNEDAHMQLMRSLALAGQPAAALRQFEAYARTLQAELGLEPSDDAVKLCEQIRAGETPLRPAALPTGETAWLPGAGERRQVTVLACGRVASDASDGLDDPDGPGDACERYCEPVYQRFGGRRALRQGEACLVYFGYPHAFEDAPRRAVHSALEVVRSTANAGVPRSIGIHTGAVRVGESRGRRWLDRDLTGPALDLARDCRRLAGPGDVLVTAATQRLTADAFTVEALEARLAHAPPASAAVYCVRGETALQGRLEWLAQTHRLTEFSGRDAELARLHRLLEQARQGRGQSALVRGEPGIGKSRLVWELRQSAPALRWLAARCLPYYRNTSLYPIITLLEGLLGFEPGDSAEARQAKLSGVLAWYGLESPSAAWLLALLLGLPTAAPAPESLSRGQRQQMRALFLALALKAAAEQPLGLVVEDLHWADPSTVEWLGELLPALAAAPCLALLTARPDFNPPWLEDPTLRPAFSLLPLHPLAPEQAEMMLSDIIGADFIGSDDGGTGQSGGAPPDATARHAVIHHADGIPLFIEELARPLLEAQRGADRPGHAVEIPVTLVDSLTARLDRLGAARETAQWAAVIGREFFYPVLEACVPYEPGRLHDDLARLIAADLVVPVQYAAQDLRPVQPGGQGGPLPERFMFRHALMQEAVYAALLRHTRQAYHQRVAEVLAARFPLIAETRPEVLASHYFEAGLKPQAVDFWLRAGGRATAQGATLEAHAFYDRALSAVDAGDIERRWQALLGREMVFNMREEREAQQGDIQALLALAEASDNDERRAQAFLRQASYGIRKKDFHTVLQSGLAAAAAAGRAGLPRLEVIGLAMQATGLGYLEDWETGDRVVASALAKLDELADDDFRAYTLADLAFYHMRSGNPYAALPMLLSGAAATRQVGDRRKQGRYQVNLGFTYVLLGRADLAGEIFENGLALAEATGDQALQTSLRYNLSYACWCTGDRERARAIGERALAEYRATGYNTVGLAFCLSYLGFYCEAEGNYAAAVNYLAESHAMFLGLDAASYRMEGQAVEARCRLALGQRDDAARLALEVWEHLCEHGAKGIDFPARAYNALADVFSALETPGVHAQDVIATGCRGLMQMAEKITDPEWRRSFLENVAENREIVERGRSER